MRTYAWQYASGDGSLTKFTFPSTTTSCLTYTYDALKHLTKRTTTVTGTLRGSKEYSYLAGSGTNGTTTLVSQLKNKDGSGNVTQSYTYTYDNVGNILTVSGSSSESYTYDTHDKLKKAVVNGVTYTYTYDVNGNILSKSDGTNTDTYTYGNTNWVDLLTKYNGTTITYDTVGNPTSWYDGATMTWVNGRRLASISATSAHGAMSFTYDADGLRLTKTVGGVEHRYLWQNGKLVSEAWGDKFLEFFYDEKGVPLSFLYRSSATADVWKYLYVTNLQGDVIGITTPDGESRAVYTYDPFGKPLTATGAMASINPLRYRGYYYDTESGLYYLKSRYYDPGICRFINADSFASTGQSFVGFNMFAYCNDNPVCNKDFRGSLPIKIMDTDGDGEDDCYVYEYSYSYVVSNGLGIFRKKEVTSKGRLYIYKSDTYNPSENSLPEDFVEGQDFIVGDLTDQRNPNIQVFNSYKCDRKPQMEAIVDVLLEYGAEYAPSWNRTKKSLITEWVEHNKYSPFSDRAKHVDFDNAEEGKGSLYYFWKAVSSVF